MNTKAIDDFLPEGLRIRYSCHDCGIYRAEVVVPYRPSEMEVTHWVGQVVGAAIAQDHNSKSPGCYPDALADVMIPVHDSQGWVGGPVQQ